MAITYRAYFNAIQKETMPDIIKYLNNNKLQELSTNRSPPPYKITDSPNMYSIKKLPICLVKPLVREPFDQGTPLSMGHLFV